MTDLRMFRTESGSRVALIGEAARIYTPVVYIDTPIKVHKVPNGDAARYSHETVPGKNQKPSTAARKMLKAGKRLGITKGARKFLRDVINA